MLSDLLYFLFQDAIALIILAIFFLCGMIPAASSSAKWAEPPALCEGLDSVDNPFGFTCDEVELTAELGTLSVR